MAVIIIASLAVAAIAIVAGLALSTFTWPIIILTTIALAIQAAIFITVRTPHAHDYAVYKF